MVRIVQLYVHKRVNIKKDQNQVHYGFIKPSNNQHHEIVQQFIRSLLGSQVLIEPQSTPMFPEIIYFIIRHGEFVDTLPRECHYNSWMLWSCHDSFNPCPSS